MVKKLIMLSMVLASLLFLTIALEFAYSSNSKKDKDKELVSNAKVPCYKIQDDKIHNIHELLLLSPQALEKVDIALMNLVCAQGLKGADNLDFERCLSMIDNWAEIIRADTISRLPIFYQNPARYDHSENLYKVVNMVLYLKDKLGIHYDPTCVNNKDFSNPEYIFIHGLLDGKHSGTCTSIPVLCVAIGRRLGYPLKLVLAKSHIFFRWEDDNERFNVEACCLGVDSHDDEYYKKWPELIDEIDLKKGYYLKSLTTAEELSLFMGARALTLRDNGQLYEAQVAYANACLLMPGHVPPLLDLLGLIDYQLNKIAEAESKITGRPADYAIHTIFDGRETYFVWQQRLNRPVSNIIANQPYIDVDALTRQAETASASRRRSLYGERFEMMPIAQEQQKK